MNNKGFTIIEVLATITIIALFAIIVTPNVYKSVNNAKKDRYIADAKEMISKARYRKSMKKYKYLFNEENNCNAISLKNLGVFKMQNPDKGYYDTDQSGVMICLENDEYKYYIKLISNKGRSINNYTNIEELTRANIN